MGTTATVIWIVQQPLGFFVIDRTARRGILVYATALADAVFQGFLFQACRLKSLFTIFPSPDQLLALLTEELLDHP